MTIFFTSDTHFRHARIIELSHRPFESVQEMDETIISNFNEQAGPEDTIFHLGDACLGKLEDSLPCISEINASVVLVPGNHDRMSDAYHHKGDREAKVQRFIDMYLEHFSLVLPDARTHVIGVGDQQFSISHYPFEGDHFMEDRFPEMRPVDQGFPLLHGHVHEMWKFNGRQFNVGVDVNDFRLVTEDEVLEWAATL